MRALYQVIIKADNAYNNEVELSNNQKLIVNATIDSVEHINRIGEVISAPIDSILKDGDKVIVHHNIMRNANTQSKNEYMGNYYIGDGLYFVNIEEVYMYRRGDSEWTPLNPYCFLTPIQKDLEVYNGIYICHEGYKGNKEALGILKYPNESLLNKGLNIGDELVFSEFSEYEFDIDGVINYKMETTDILAVV